MKGRIGGPAQGTGGLGGSGLGHSTNAQYVKLRQVFPQQGTVQWIGLRPASRVPMRVVASAEAAADLGLVGDRYAGTSGKRQVTLVNVEHLALAGALLGRGALEPERLRRNVAVSGINLIALVGRRFQVGDVVLEGTGLCEPCERMEAAFGPGAFNALWGHAGITARVLSGGVFSLGDVIRVVDAPQQVSLDL